MPPVGAAIGAAVTGVGASISTALTGAAFSSFAVKAFTQIAIGVAFSAVSRMLMPGRKLARQGVRTSVGFGEDAPSTIILGRTATAGDLVYANSHGHDNEYYVLVLELSDLPARLRRVMVNDWISAPSSSPATALLPTCAETISAVRARSSLRSMLWLSGILGL